MAKIITENKIIEAVKGKTFIKDGKSENVEGVKYDFCLSSRILKSKYKKPIDINKLSETERANLVIEPGEVVFALTEETLDLPNNMIANLSPKRKLGHEGILIITGFCIDPLYNGKLLVGMYNFSSSPFPIMPGKKLIAALFYELQEDEVEEFKRPDACIQDFPEDIVNMMERYSPISIESLNNDLSNVHSKLNSLEKRFVESNRWFEKYQEKLDKSSEASDKLRANLKSLSESLEKEAEDRKMSIKELRELFYERDTQINDKLNDKLIRIIAIMSGLAVGISTLIVVLSKYFL